MATTNRSGRPKIQSFRGGERPAATPTRRRLRVYAFDPSLSTRLETWRTNQVTLSIPWERLGYVHNGTFIAGPVGDYLEVVDVDPASGAAYEVVNLDDPSLLATDGLVVSEVDPRFHQQMVYAVASSTIAHFERALGRTALWSPRWKAIDPKSKRELSEAETALRPSNQKRWLQEYVHRLRIYPHAMREANAYYSPEKKALLFGYFKAIDDGSGLVMPGSTVFTCLSHDVVAHETTHALLDGLHPYFTDPSNPDVLAFHEAFADIVSLFSRFSMPEVVRTEIARARGQLDAENMLGSLALQFGAATGKRSALRDAIGTVKDGRWVRRAPDPALIRNTFEPHARGSLLVAAVFDAFLGIYRGRTSDLIRIASGGTGQLPAGELHPDLVDRLSREAYTAARHVLTMCIRALDYCPPVDITFGEYLRALITADSDMVPDDDKNYRIAMIEGFRRHGIYPQGVSSMSEEALKWEQPQFSKNLQKCIASALQYVEQDERRRDSQEKESGRSNPASINPMTFGVAGSISPLRTRRGMTWSRMDRACAVIREFLLENLRSDSDIQWQLGVCVGDRAPGSVHAEDRSGKPSFQVNRLRQSRRIGPGGMEVSDYVLEITQKRDGYLNPDRQKQADSLRRSARSRAPYDFMVRGGCTLNIDMRSHQVRYCVAKNILSERRLEAQRRFMGDSSPGMGIYARARTRETFAMLHRE